MVDENGERKVVDVPFTSPENLRKTKAEVRFIGEMFDAEGNPDIDVTNRQFKARLETLTEKDSGVDFNVISSVYGKLKKNIAGWITSGRLLYANKEKALWFLSHQSAPIAAAAANQGLSNATKIVQNFENV